MNSKDCAVVQRALQILEKEHELLRSAADQFAEEARDAQDEADTMGDFVDQFESVVDAL